MDDIDAIHVGLLILRLGVGITFSLHGFQKLFGWFGGGGLDGTAGWFRSLGFSKGRGAAIAAGLSEVAGGLGLAVGLLTPVAAAAVIGTMTTAAWVNRHDSGFWSVNKGWELNGYLIVVAWALATTGPGRWSLDQAFDTHLASVAAGILALGTGVAGGSYQWFSRQPPDEAG